MPFDSTPQTTEETTRDERITKAVVDALRSGKYTQCRGDYVRYSEEEGISYCALGVACKVMTGHTVYAPALRCFDSEDNPISVVRMNDTDGWTFSKIAEYIESHNLKFKFYGEFPRIIIT